MRRCMLLSANKLASKHHRVALLSNSNSHLPNCDIIEAAGYLFCLGDRALLRPKCDVSIHTINSLVSSHQRFLLTGVKVGLEAVHQAASKSTEKITEPERSRSVSATTLQMSVQAMSPFTGGSSGDSVQQWQGDSGKLAESDRVVGAMEVIADCLDHVPEASWAVPEMCSPPTATGLCWSKTRPHHQSRLGCDTFVPNVCYLPTPKRRQDF